MFEEELPEGFKVESIPDPRDEVQPQAQAPQTEEELPPGFEVESTPQGDEGLPVWMRENVVPREAAPSQFDAEGRQIGGSSAGVPSGFESTGAPAPEALPPRAESTLQGTQVEPSAPETGNMGPTAEQQEIVVPLGATPTPEAPTSTEEVPAELPVPADNMYSGMSYQDAKDVYDAYRRHPASEESPVSGLSYRGKAVPIPQPTPEDAASGKLTAEEEITAMTAGAPDRVSLASRTGHALREGAEDIAKTTLALGDVIGDDVRVLTGNKPKAKGEGGFEAFKENVEGPDLNQQSTVGSLYEDAVKITLGATAGGAVAPEMFVAKVSPMLARMMVKSAQAVGGAAAMDPDSGTLVTGDKAMIPLFKGFNIDPNDPEAEQYLTKKLNFLQDAAITAGVTGPAAWVGNVLKDIAGDIARPIVKAGSEKMQRTDETKRLIGALYGFTGRETPAEYKQKALELSEIIKGNKNLKIAANEPGIEDINIKRDPLSAVQHGASQENPALAERTAAVKESALRGDNTQLELKLREPQKNLKKLTEQTQEAFGGEEAMGAAKSGVEKSALEEVGAAKSAVEGQKATISEAESNVADLIKNDPSLGSRINQVSGTTNFDVDKLKNQSADSVVNSLKTAYKDAVKKKDELFAKITADKTINLPEAKSYNDLVTNAMKNKYLSNETIESMKEANGKFGPTFNIVRGKIKKDINKAYQQGDGHAAEALQALYKNIDEDQVQALIRSGAKKGELGKDAQAAVDFYRDEFSPLWNDGPLKDFADTFKSTEGRGIRPTTMAQKGQDIVKGAVTADKSHYANQIHDALQKSGDETSYGDFVLGDAASQIAAKAQATGGKLSELDVSDIVSSLRNRASTLPENSPVRGRIQGFLDNFAQKKGDIKGMQDELKNLEAKAKEVENNVMNGHLKTVFGESDPYLALKDYFNNKKTGENLKDLLTRADSQNDPLLRKGIQAAYARYIDENLMGGTSDFSRGNAKSFAEGWSGLKEKGREIFSDKPNVAYVFERLVDEALSASEHTVGRVPLVHKGADQKLLQEAMNKVITLVAGPLSRIGARMRVASGTLVRKADVTGKRQEIFENLISDADYMENALEELTKLKGPALTKAQKNLSRRILQRTAVTSQQDDDTLSEEMEFEAQPEKPSAEEETNETLK